ncbi:pentapeptide repeat-containing protein [Candidatus Cyanaurora vandensis]|uniref:pentapeptide repeat-containing protein n=1 Tax=Candidatus Cyanaurora vandensis TaxID=2714958 RepID=UPI00257E0008|nr:pentapeptide repeat-containing protein [Candidatus Cyanaurora vandensis]
MDQPLSKEAMIRKIKAGEAAQVDFYEADLLRADLAGVNLRDLELVRSHFVLADLQDSCLAGANLSRAWLIGADLQRADLQGANLRDANLEAAVLDNANLEGTDLSRANLRGCQLCGANLRGADLSRADLSGARLDGADLSGAVLRDSILMETQLGWVNLSGADVSRARLDGAFFNDETQVQGTDFYNCNGLALNLGLVLAERGANGLDQFRPPVETNGLGTMVQAQAAG